MSPDIHNWTVATSLTQLRHFIRTLDVPQATIQQFIVRTSAAGQATAAETTTTTTNESEVCNNLFNGNNIQYNTELMFACPMMKTNKRKARQTVLLYST